MGWFEGWPFKSREQTDKERQEFERRIFPLGEGQRAAASALLDELIVVKRMKTNDKLFAFIVAKDHYEQGGRGPEAVDDARAQLEPLRWLKDDNLALLLAMVRLDALVEDLESYPTAEDVRRLAGSAEG